MQFYTIHLPVKTYVRKYLQKTYGQTIVINQKSKLGKILLLALSSNLPTKMGENDIDVRLARMNDTLPVKVPMDYWYRLGVKEINPCMAINIGRIFEDEFEEDLHKIVDRAKTFLGVERKTAIEYFANNHNIDLEVDISSEALKKMEYRYRTSQEQPEKNTKKSMAGLSSAFSLFG
jgi:hypothetical protein